MLTALVLFFALQADRVSPTPDVKNFKPVLTKELEFRIDDCKTGFVGRVVVYQNPDDPNGFVRVYYRQVAIVSERACENNTAEEGGPSRNLSNLNYHRKQETEALGRVQQATDAFAYVQWRTMRDARTGEDIQSGPMQIWLLDSSGSWAYHAQPVNEKSALESSSFSEPAKTNPEKQVIVGVKFTLGNRIHIVRIDQDDIPAPVKEKEQKEGRQ